MADSAANPRRWTHRDLVQGRCTAEEYVADLKADVDRRLARRFGHETTDRGGSYSTVYRSFGRPVPYWLWKLTPSRYRELVLS